MSDRGVLVVGATSDIGVAIARAFTVDGDRVVGLALDTVNNPASSSSSSPTAPVAAPHLEVKSVQLPERSP